MSIEILYIFPLVSLSIFFLVLAMQLQKKEKDPPPRQQAPDDALLDEVQRFNEGEIPSSYGSKVVENRLNEVEKEMKVITGALGSQQRVIEHYHETQSDFTIKIDKLKKKLREVSKEYGLVLDENQALRIRLRKMLAEMTVAGDDIIEGISIGERPDDFSPAVSAPKAEQKPKPPSKKALFEDTKIIERAKLANLSDTAEIDLSEL